MVERENPYLTLGLPFGAAREEANVAFARRARALRRQGESGHAGLLALTRALNQIDEAITNPEAAIDVYRVPADPNAFEREQVGVLAPPPERAGRAASSAGQDVDLLVERAATELLTAVVNAYQAGLKLPTY